MGERKEKMRGERAERKKRESEEGKTSAGVSADVKEKKGGEERNGRRSGKCSRKKNAQLKSVDFL